MEINDRLELARYFNLLGFEKGAEIGVSCGNYSKKLCEQILGLKLYCIDIWQTYVGNKRSPNNERQENHYKEAKEKLKPYNVFFMRMMSMDAVKLFADESLDFVFIDANHDYQYVLDDITEWSKKVRSGGIVSGHDYYKFRGSGVIEAVTKYLSDKPKIRLHITTKHRKPAESHCFWWVKP